MLNYSKIEDFIERNPIYTYLLIILAIACIIFEFSLPSQFANNLTNMILLIPAVIFSFIFRYKVGLKILFFSAAIHLATVFSKDIPPLDIVTMYLPMWLISLFLYVLISKQLEYKETINQELSLRKEFEQEALMESTMLLEKNTILEKEIKERVRYQRELKNTNKYYANLIENAGIAMGISDLDGNINYVNEIFAQLYALPKDEIIGQPFLNILPIEEQTKLYRLFSEKISGEFTPGSLRTHIVNSKGELIHVHLISDLVYDNEEVIGVRAYVWDITEQVLAENAIKESEEKFRSIFEYSPMGIYRSTPEGKILLANPALLKMLHYPDLESFKSLDLNESHPALYERHQFIKELEENGKIIGRIAEWERYDGALLYIKETSWAIKNENGDIIYFDGIVDDVTEQVQIEQEKERLIEQLMSAKSEIHRLSGMLPICSSCKKIRDDTGYWHQLEVYIDDHSDAQFSHGICPQCAKSLYPGYSDDTDET